MALLQDSCKTSKISPFSFRTTVQDVPRILFLLFISILLLVHKKYFVKYSKLLTFVLSIYIMVCPRSMEAVVVALGDTSK